MECAVCRHEMDLIATEYLEGHETSKPKISFSFLCARCFSYTVEMWESGAELVATISGNLKRNGKK